MEGVEYHIIFVTRILLLSTCFVGGKKRKLWSASVSCVMRQASCVLPPACRHVVRLSMLRHVDVVDTLVLPSVARWGVSERETERLA